MYGIILKYFFSELLVVAEEKWHRIRGMPML